MRLRVQQLTAGSLFYLGLLANLGFWLPVGGFWSVLALSGFNTVRVTGRPVYGLAGFLIGMAVALGTSLIGAAIFTIGTKIAGLIGDRLPPLEISDERRA